MDGSFEDNDVEKSNAMLEEQAQAWTKHGSGFYPGIVVNEVIYRGDISPDDVFQAICSGFKNKPSVCMNNVEGVFTGISPNTLIIVVVFLLAVNVVLLLIYRKFHNKEQ